MKQDKHKFRIDKGITISLGLLIFSIILIFIPYNYFNGKEIGNFKIVINDYGNLGSFIAGVTAPCISIAAFILLYLTYKSQKRELEATQKVLEKQDSTLRKQQFESTFFHLLESHKKLVENIGTPKDKGIQYFRKIHYDLKDDYKFTKEYFDNENVDNLINRSSKNKYLTRERINELIESYKQGDNVVVAKFTYQYLFQNNHLYLGHYFRHLYHILKFINERIIEEKGRDKNISDEDLFQIFKAYADILQSTLSSYELSLLFYNILFFDRMKALVVTFDFLENLAIEDLMDKEHKNFFHDIVLTERNHILKI